MLDPILKAYVEEDWEVEDRRDGLRSFLVQRVVRMVDRAEYKRRQAPRYRMPEPGKDRRLPITNRHRPAGLTR